MKTPLKKSKEQGEQIKDTSGVAGAGAEKTSKAAKESGKAEKELTKELEKQRDKRFTDLKHSFETSEITEAEYYSSLGTLRDEYFEEGSDEWQNYTLEIYKYNKALVEQQKKDIIQLYTDIATEAGKKLDEVLKLQEVMESKLKAFGRLYSTVRITKGKDKQEFMQLNDLSKDVDALNAYKKAIQGVRDRGAPQKFMSVMKDMSVEEGTAFANLLMQSSDAKFEEYIDQWKTKQEIATEISRELYKEETDEKIKYWTDELERVGLQVPAGFFDNGKTAAENFGRGFS